MNPIRRNVFRVLMASIVLVAAEYFGATLLVHFHLMQHLLAPGAGSLVAVLVALGFLLLRILVIVLLPGLLAAIVFVAVRRTGSTGSSR